MSNKGICPIWGTPAIISPTSRDGDKVDSPRAGGEYFITGTAKATLESRDASVKARLTTWLIDQRLQGTNKPEITSATITQAQQQRPLLVYERADRLLKYIELRSLFIGSGVDIPLANPISPIILEMLARSESTRENPKEELLFLLKYLTDRHYIDVPQGGYAKTVLTVEGYAHLAELEKHVNSSQAFVAMWFDDSMIEAYEKGMGPGIEDAGYKPLPINRKEHINKIDDEIIAEIRRSRFLVADFTQGDDGARGGVYYEAGFAYGLGIPVIYTCREDVLVKLHFDTRQYNHIVWKTHSDLRKQLAVRISAVIGDGPHKSAKAE